MNGMISFLYQKELVNFEVESSYDKERNEELEEYSESCIPGIHIRLLMLVN